MFVTKTKAVKDFLTAGGGTARAMGKNKEKTKRRSLYCFHSEVILLLQGIVSSGKSRGTNTV